MTQPVAWYRGYLHYLELAKEHRFNIIEPWSSQKVAMVFALLTDQQEVARDWEKTLRDERLSVEDSPREAELAYYKECQQQGRGAALELRRELLLRYRDEGKDEDAWSNGLTYEQVDIISLRLCQEIVRVKLLLLGEEP